MLRRRATLLRVWRLTPDREVRAALETDLYGRIDPDRAATEAERLSDLGAGNGGGNPRAWTEPPAIV